MKAGDSEMVGKSRSLCMASVRQGQEVCRSSVLRQAMASKSHSLEETGGSLAYVWVSADSHTDSVESLKRCIQRNVNSKAKFAHGSYHSACTTSLPGGCGFQVNGFIELQYLCLPGQISPECA
jgi:hypothetical protein